MDSLRAVVASAPLGRPAVQALLTLSSAYLAIDSAQSRRYAQQALRTAQQQRLDTLEAEAALATGLIFREQDKPRVAEHYYKAALALFLKLGIREKAGACYHHLGIAYNRTQRYPEALTALRTELGFYRLATDKKQLINCYNAIGVVYYGQGRSQQAVNYMLKSLHLAEQLGDSAGVALMLRNIGATYAYDARKEVGEAIRYAKHALRMYEALHEEVEVAAVLCDLGFYYTKKPHYPEAVRYLNAGLRHQRQLGVRARQLSIATIYACFGEIAGKQGNWHLALRQASRADSMFQRLEKDDQRIEALATMATAQQHLGQPRRAWHHAQVALSLAQKLAVPADLAVAYETLTNLSLAQQRYALAYAYRLRYDQQQDSILNKEKHWQLAELYTKYETAQKEAQIQALRHTTAVEQARTQLQRRSRNAVLLLLLLSTLAGLLLYWQYRLQRRANQQLQEQDVAIAAQNKNLTLVQQQLRKTLGEKDVLLKEVHHRVKNNLQIVASLLLMQATEQSRSQEVLAAAREGEAWIKAIALVHEMLYQSADLTNLSSRAFVERLLDSLRVLYDAPAGRIQYALDVTDIPLTTSTAVPLGLIINELLANVYKHAFPAGQAGRVHVRLNPQLMGATYVLSVEDNGVGLPPDFGPEHITSLGLRLVKMLAKQLNGALEMASSTQGTRMTVTFQLAVDRELPT